jgi:hypothetical protein
MKTLILTIITLFAMEQMCSAQTRIIGRVTSSVNGQAIAGATIKQKGSTAGVSADTSGRFTIFVSTGNVVLVVSSLGYQTREVLPAASSELLIELEPALNVLSEVVVV